MISGFLATSELSIIIIITHLLNCPLLGELIIDSHDNDFILSQ